MHFYTDSDGNRAIELKKQEHAILPRAASLLSDLALVEPDHAEDLKKAAETLREAAKRHKPEDKPTPARAR